MDKTKEVLPYHPNKEVAKYTTNVYSDYQYCRSLRDQSYAEFDDMTPDRYWNEARKRVKNYLPPLPAGEELANIFFGKTRNKRNVIAAFVAAQRPRVEITVRGGVNTKKSDRRLSQMLRTAYDYFMDAEDADSKYLDWTLEALDVGTGYILEDYDFRVRDVKTVLEEDHGTGIKKWKKEQRVYMDQCYAQTVPVEDVFIPNFYEHDLQEQPYVIMREYIPRIIAEQRYQHHTNFKYVPYSSPTIDEKESDEYFFQLLEDRIEDNFVEVLHYFDKWNDRHNIFANGVLLTDIENPIRFDHKNVPLSKTVYEKIGPSFAYGMSLPMKIVSEQDAYNELGNNNMDRSRISSIPKMLSSYESELEQETFESFDVIKTDNENGLREFQFQSVKPGDIQFLQLINEIIDESTVDASFSGAISGATATEIMNNRAQNVQNLGLFLTYIYSAAKRHAEMRLQNILQYFFLDSKRYNGKDFEMRELSTTEKLQDGIDGTRIIRVVSSKDKIPSKDEIRKEKERGMIPRMDDEGKKVGEKVEVNYDIIYTTPQEIADLSYSVNIVPGSSLPETQSLKKALVLELANTMSQPQFAQQTDFSKIQQLVIETFGYTVDDIRPDESADEQVAGQDMQQMQQLLAGGQQPVENSELVQQMAGTQMPGTTGLLSE